MPDDGVLGARLNRLQLEQLREALGGAAEVLQLTAELFQTVRGDEAPDGLVTKVRESLELVESLADDLVARQQESYRRMLEESAAAAEPDVLRRLIVKASDRLPKVPLERAVPIRLHITSRPLDVTFSPRMSRRMERRYRYQREALFPNQRLAQRKARELLLADLTPEQRESYQLLGSFDVVGGQTGRRYRICHGQVQNILELDDTGAPVRRWCCHPPDVPEEDAMLAQKLHLEQNEDVFIQTANLIGGPRRE